MEELIGQCRFFLIIGEIENYRIVGGYVRLQCLYKRTHKGKKHRGQNVLPRLTKTDKPYIYWENT